MTISMECLPYNQWCSKKGNFILERKKRVWYEKGLSALELHSEYGQDCIIAFAVQEQMKLAEGRFKINQNAVYSFSSCG